MARPPWNRSPPPKQQGTLGGGTDHSSPMQHCTGTILPGRSPGLGRAVDKCQARWVLLLTDLSLPPVAEMAVPRDCSDCATTRPQICHIVYAPAHAHAHAHVLLVMDMEWPRGRLVVVGQDTHKGLVTWPCGNS